MVTVVVGWLVFRGLRAVLPRRPGVIAPAAALGALVSVPAAAAVFTLLFAVGGTAPVETGSVLAAMLGWHVLIGVGEAIITGLVVGAVMTARPDLVHGAQDLVRSRPMEIRTTGSAA